LTAATARLAWAPFTSRALHHGTALSGREQGILTPRKRQILIAISVFACVLVTDQVTKAVVRAKLSPLEAPVITHQGPFFQLSHQHNPGLVGGMFRENRTIALLAPMVATLVLLYLFTHLNPQSRLQAIAFGLVAGGAIGNLADRVRLGHVTDFLQFHFYFVPFNFPWKIYPAFNVADTGICTGVFLLVLTWNWLEKSDVPDPA